MHAFRACDWEPQRNALHKLDQAKRGDRRLTHRQWWRRRQMVNASWQLMHVELAASDIQSRRCTAYPCAHPRMYIHTYTCMHNQPSTLLPPASTTISRPHGPAYRSLLTIPLVYAFLSASFHPRGYRSIAACATVVSIHTCLYTPRVVWCLPPALTWLCGCGCVHASVHARVTCVRSLLRARAPACACALVRAEVRVCAGVCGDRECVLRHYVL